MQLLFYQMLRRRGGGKRAKTEMSIPTIMQRVAAVPSDIVQVFSKTQNLTEFKLFNAFH